MALRDGWIRIELHHKPEGRGGLLTVRVLDSGEGFEPGEVAKELGAHDRHHGRGIPLVRKLCKEVSFLPDRKGVEAVYKWG